MGLFFSDLKAITSGEIIHIKEDVEISHLLIDSRKIVNYKGALFFAIVGPRHDGHKFIEELFNKGIRQFIVSDTSSISSEIISKSNVLKVPDVVGSLQGVVSDHRRKFKLEVIAVTGSNGKTIVKEWLGQILSTAKKVVKSPKSYNSQVGVPLSVWQISDEDEIGVFEAGISQPGEMVRLEQVIQPTIGIITNLGSAHDAGFDSREQKLTEKLRLFDHCEKIIYCADHSDIHASLSELNNESKSVQLISWSSKGKEATYNYEIGNGGISCDGMLFPFDQTGQIAIENMLHCLTVAQVIGLEPEQIVAELKKITGVPMRQELKRGTNGCYLVDDTYNNDFSSLEAAIDFLIQQSGNRKKTVILSDLLQTGLSAGDLYEKVSLLLKSKGVERLIGVGLDISKNGVLFDSESTFYDSTNSLLGEFQELEFRDEIILVKGARSFEFEGIVDHLQEKVHGTRLEINLNALTENLNYYRSVVSPDVKIMAMVKALAYGGGSVEIANLLQYHKVDYLAVAYPDEGIELRKKGITLPIMVMNVGPESMLKLSFNKLEPVIYSLSQLNELRHLHKLIGPTKVHLKIDTGMNRLGFNAQQLDEVGVVLKKNKWIVVVSIFSHLAASEDPTHDDATLQQCVEFVDLCEKMDEVLGYQSMRHILNSAGISRFPDFQLDMVRLGIGLYGIDTDAKVQSQLLPVSSLKTSVSQIRKVKKGETVGYGKAYVSKKETSIATIAIGYADGFDRRFGNGVGKVLINGQLAPVVGNICMDMTMVDVTGIEVKEGDEVVIFGKGLPVTELATSIGTIPYEILTSVGARVKRVFHSG